VVCSPLTSQTWYVGPTKSSLKRNPLAPNDHDQPQKKKKASSNLTNISQSPFFYLLGRLPPPISRLLPYGVLCRRWQRFKFQTEASPQVPMLSHGLIPLTPSSFLKFCFLHVYRAQYVAAVLACSHRNRTDAVSAAYELLAGPTASALARRNSRGRGCCQATRSPSSGPCGGRALCQLARRQLGSSLWGCTASTNKWEVRCALPRLSAFPVYFYDFLYISKRWLCLIPLHIACEIINLILLCNDN
jgi:hypothetical protein